MVKKLLHCVGADLTNETSVYIIWCLFKAIRRDGRLQVEQFETNHMSQL